MAREERDPAVAQHILSQLLRREIIDASPEALDEALRSAGADPAALAAQGRSAITRALSQYWSRTDHPRPEAERRRNSEGR